MSKQIDERVVEMTFDNKDFEKNVKQSMSTIDRLKSALNFKGAAKGLEDINRQAKSVNFNQMGSAIDQVRVKFNALQIAGTTALANITNSIVTAGRNMMNQFTLAPVINGFQEYETQLNSVQTIMANTASKGTTIDQVTDALNELNTYADKTIYNFTEMTRNIGTFTAAGVDLETSVSAIQGIANLAAMSGSTSVQASTAMYQLSQALAAGKVSLMDWNSVVNAGMGGEQFQNALKRTATAMGTNVDAIIEKYGSFRESLTQGQWLTTEVLTETLKQISGAYSEADLISQGYTEDQARDIVEMAQTAEDAATKVKTFTQMIDTLKEAVGSGWAQTWQTIFGDFYEARDFWTNISNMLGDMVNASSEARNEVLDGAFNSSFDQLGNKIEDAGGSFQDFQEIVKQTARDHGIAVDDMINDETTLADLVQNGTINGDVVRESLLKYIDGLVGLDGATQDANKSLQDFSEIVNRVIRGDFGNAQARVEALTQAGYDYATIQDLVNKKLAGQEIAVSDLNDEQLKNVGYTDEEIAALRELGDQAKLTDSDVDKLIKTLERPSGRELFLESIQNILQAIIRPMQAFSAAWHDIFSIDSSQVYGILEGFNHFTESLIISDETSDKLQRTFKGLFSILSIFTNFAGGTFSAVFKVIQGVLDNFDIGILDVTAGIGDAITAFAEFVNQNNIVNAALDFLADRITDVIKWVSTFAQKVRELGIVEFAISKISSAFEVARIIGKNLFDGLQPYIQQFIDLISNIQNMSFEEFLTQLKDIFNRVVEFASGKISSILTVLGSTFSDVFGKIADALGWIPPLAQDAGGALLNMIKNVYNRIKSVGGGGLVALIFGIGAIATFKVITGLINKITSPIKTLSDTISGIGEAIDKYIDAKAFRVKSEAIRNIAISIAILAGAVFLLAQLEPDRLVSAAVAVGGLAVALGVMTALMGVAGKLGIDKFADSILKLSASVLLVAASLKVMEGIDSDTIVPNIVAIITVIGVLAGLALALDKFGSKGKAEDFGGPALQILALAAAVRIVADAFVALNAINPDNLLPTIIGLISVVGAMGILAFAMDRLKIGGGGVGLLAMVIGLRAFIFVLEGVAGMDIGTILSALPNFITLVGLIAALMFATKLAGGNAVAAGGSIILMSAGILIMVQAIKQIAGMNASDIDKGVEVITRIGVIFAALVAVTKIAGDNAVKAGASLILMSLAMLILTGVIALISMMDPAGLAQGLAAITVLGLIFSVLIGVTHFAKGVHKEIIAMAAVVGVLVAAVAVLSLMDPAAMEKSVEALTLLMGAFALMMGASQYATGAYGAMFAMVGVVALLATILGVMAALDIEASITNAAALGILLTSLSAAFLISSFAKGDPKDLAKTSLAMLAMVPAMAAIGLVLAEIQALGVDAQLNNVAALAVLLGELAGITVILSKFNVDPVAAAKGAAAMDIVAVIIGALIGLVGLLNQVTQGGVANAIQAAIPVMQGIGQAIGEFVGGLVGGLVSGAGKAIMSMLPELGSSLTKFWLNVQPFILGTKMMGDDVFGGIKTLVEALMLITGADFLDNLNEFFQGESTMTGFSKNLTGLAEGLVEFSNVLSEGNFNGDIVEKAANAAKALGEMQSCIQGENGLFSMFTGTKDLGNFGGQLAKFGEGLVDFSNSITDNGGIDEDAVTAAANAGKIMAELQGAISGEGESVMNWIMGEKNLGSFGEQLKAYGKALVEFSNEVSGDNAINMDAVTSAKNAGDIMAALQGSLKDTGEGFSLSKFFSGEQNLENFGNQMKAFGQAMVDFSEIIVGAEDTPGIDSTAIENAAAMGTVMSDLANSLPTYTFGSGKLDLTGFGYDLTNYATSIATMSGILATVDLTKIDQAADVAQVVSDVLVSLQGIDESVINKFWVLEDLATTLTDFSTGIVGVDIEQINLAVTAATRISNLITGLSGITSESISGFSSAVSQLGQVSYDQIVSSFNSVDFSQIGVTVMSNLARGFSTGSKTVITQINITMNIVYNALKNNSSGDFKSVGSYLIGEFAAGISQNGSLAVNNANAIKLRAVTALQGAYNEAMTAGRLVAQGFAQGISIGTSSVAQAARSMASAAVKAARQAMDIHSPSRVMMRIGEYAGEGFVNGLTAYSDYSYNAGMTLAESVVEGISTLKGVYDSFTDLDAVYAEFTELAEKLVETEEDQQKETEETTEKTSKLSDALNSVMDSLEGVIDRKKDINALTTIIEKAGDRLSEGFIAELFSSDGAYAGALSEMVNLTEEQLGKLSDVFDDIDISEKIEAIVDKVSEGIKELSDRTANINAINELITKPGLNLSDAFVAELMNSSGEYADTAAGLIKLNANQINQIAAMYDKNQSLDRMQSAVDALAESMTDLTNKKRDFNSLNATLKRTGVTLDKRFTEELMDSSGQFADALAGISEMSDEMLQKLNDTFLENEYMDQVQEFTSILAGNDSLATAFEYSGEQVDGFVEKIVNAGEDISDVMSIIEDFADTVSDGFSKMEIKDQTGVSEFTDNLENNIIMAREWASNVETVFDKLGNYPFADQFRQEIMEGGFDKYGRIIAELATQSKEQIISLIKLWNTADIYGSQLGTDVVDAITPTAEEMEYAGSSIVEGMAHGVIMNTSSATDAITLMCQAVENETRTYFGIHSPSDLMEQLGRYLVEGFVRGLNSGTEALKAAMAQVSQAVEFLQSIGEKGIDIEVRVTPVIDMADFNAKISALQSSASSMLSSDVLGKVDTINATMGQNGPGLAESKLSAAVDKLTSKVDSINPDNFGVTYQQINNSPKALSTATIYRQTKNQISLARSKNGNSFKQ